MNRDKGGEKKRAGEGKEKRMVGEKNRKEREEGGGRHGRF